MNLILACFITSNVSSDIYESPLAIFPLQKKKKCYNCVCSHAGINYISGSQSWNTHIQIQNFPLSPFGIFCLLVMTEVKGCKQITTRKLKIIKELTPLTVGKMILCQNYIFPERIIDPETTLLPIFLYCAENVTEWQESLPWCFA